MPCTPGRYGQKNLEKTLEFNQLCKGVSVHSTKGAAFSSRLWLQKSSKSSPFPIISRVASLAPLSRPPVWPPLLVGSAGKPRHPPQAWGSNEGSVHPRPQKAPCLCDKENGRKPWIWFFFEFMTSEYLQVQFIVKLKYIYIYIYIYVYISQNII